jgi:2,4-dienoyl-CoA reductase-like NADH-dependent reductase (Old Yellow Enzyme family)
MSILFDPITVAGMSLRNRIVRSATAESMATGDGLPTAELRRLYERLADGGTGLIISGLTAVNRAGRPTPWLSGAYADEIIPGWREITDAVHERGAKIAMQLAHCGRQALPRGVDEPPAVAPSSVPELVYFTRPQAMTEDDILQTIIDFGDAAARVKAAGFDAVQIHAAHGYLISGFMSPLTNRRRDRWGGTPENRFRFLSEVYRSVRERVGSSFPVLCKLNMDDFIGIGLTTRDSFPAAQRLAEMGLGALEISGGTSYESAPHVVRGGMPLDVVTRGRSLPVSLYLRMLLTVARLRAPFREAYFLPYASRLKPVLSIPLILVGGIRRPETAERILEGGDADLISMSRPLIREPGLPNRWLAGDRSPAECRSCNRCICESLQKNSVRCYLKSSVG